MTCDVCRMKYDRCWTLYYHQDFIVKSGKCLNSPSLITPSPRGVAKTLYQFIRSLARTVTLNRSESIWPPPFSTGVYRNEEPSPDGQRDKEIPLSQFISSLFEGVGQLLPGDFEGLLMCRPRLLAAWDSCCKKGAAEVFRKYTGCRLGVMEFKIFGGKGWLTLSINDKGVCTTAPSTLGLVNTRSIIQTPSKLGGHQTTANKKS